MIISLDDFLRLRHDLTVVDVRSEGEFSDGHIPNVINIPLLTNEERKQVGTVYKQKGQLEAIKAGFRLVGPRLNSIIDAALQAAGQQEILVHCWRGGMRSSNFCQFIGMAGVKSHQLQGGYKAYRQRAQEAFALPLKLYAIGGCTGSGKSQLLHALAEAGEQIIDLENLASHKGSVFGGLMMPPQPTTEQFQNDLFEEILKLDFSKRIWIEDESVAIGKIFLPQSLWRTLSASQVVEVEVSKESRIARLVEEYGNADPKEFLMAMERITKKLGGQHFKAAKENLLAGNMAATIETLLEYYDKAYHNGLERKKQRIVQRVQWDGRNPKTIVNQLITEQVFRT